MPRPPSLVSAEAFEELISGYVRRESFRFQVEAIAWGFVRLRLTFHSEQLRPGGTIAGPVMFTLADTALYAGAMSVVGLAPQAVTTDLAIRFLARPGKRDLIAEGRMLKPRGRLVVGEVTIWSESQEDPVAHATGTYAIPRGAAPRVTAELT